MPKIYTKEDYLTANEYAKKHKLDIEIVKKAISQLRGVLVNTGHTRANIIVRIGNKNNSERIRPEPVAQEMFAKKIKQIQEAKK
jgi:hypothetical protein